MTTTRSFSKDSKFGPAYRAAFKAQFPVAIVSGILFLILFIVVFFVSTVDQYPPETAQNFYKMYFQQGIYAETSQSVIALLILAVIALSSTLVGMSYLHKKSTVDVYHSLPVTRPQLLGANLLATLTAALGPFLAMYLLTMVIQLVSCAGYGCFTAEYFRFICFDIMSAVVYTAAIAAFVAFMAVNVGTVFDAFAATMAIGFAPPLIYMLAGSIWQNLVYGALFEPGENWIFLSPFMFIFKIYSYMDRHRYSLTGSILARDYGSAALVLLFGAVLTAVLLILAVVCYRRRKSEIAEQTQPRGVLQTIVKLAAAFIGGSVFFAIFINTGFVAAMTATLFGAVGIGMIAELILSRGVRWIGKNLKWLLGAGAVYCLLLIGMQADIFGYASRIPELDSIASVRINYSGRFNETDQYPYDRDSELRPPLTGAESIAIVRDVHGMAVNNRPPDKDYTEDKNFDYNWLRIEYKLKNGSTISRTYNPVFNQAYGRLAELENKEDFIRANSTLFWAEENPQLAKVETVELYASIGNRSGRHKNVLDDPDILLDAIRADMLGQSLEDITNPTGPSLGFIRINFGQVESENRYGYYSQVPYAIVTVTREYTRTLEVLKQLKLDGDFTDEPLRLDEVSEAGLVPVWQWKDYYDANRVRTFSMDMEGIDNELLSWKAQYRDSLEGDNSVFCVRNDPENIEAMAKASRDTLFAPGRWDGWYKDYAIVYFEMTDGSNIVKAVKLDDLPAGIRDEARKEIGSRYDKRYSYLTEELEGVIPAETAVVPAAAEIAVEYAVIG